MSRNEAPENSTDPRLEKRYRFSMTPVRFLATEIARRLFPLLAITHISGDDPTPVEGGVIVAANHLTNFDVFPIQFAIRRPIFFMAKSEMFQNPVMDIFYREMGGFPVNRGERDEWAIEHARSILERGQVLGIFPEGTRSKEKGLRAAKTGTARLAILTNSPILPVAIYGTHRIMHRFPKRTEIFLTFGDLIFPEPVESILNLTDRLMYSLASLLPPEGRGVYAFRPPGF